MIIIKKQPLVSIIMGIYDCEETLEDSIKSIINQTYVNWQLIMCDDNSNDETYKIASKYVNKFNSKMILIKNLENIGLAGSLNHCLRYAVGDFIARQDGDDKSIETRIETQVKFLLENPKYDLVGSAMISFNTHGNIGVRGILPSIPDKNKLALKPPFCHGTIMMKSYVYKELDGYKVSKYTRRCEDIELWFRFFEKGYTGYNLVEPLYMVRDDEESYKRRNIKSYLYATKVCFDGYRLLKLPMKSYIYLAKPIIAGLSPTSFKRLYHSKLTKAN